MSNELVKHETANGNITPARLAHVRLKRIYPAEYNAWKAMCYRCLHQTSMAHRYKDRGITVCDRWRSSFVNFLADMGPRRTWRHTLDRINNEGNYEPSNCRWATRAEQQNNRSDTRFLMIDGETKSVFDWARISGVHPMTIVARLRFGWDHKSAVWKAPLVYNRKPRKVAGEG